MNEEILMKYSELEARLNKLESRSTKRKKESGDEKIKDSNHKYNHLMGAARDCFCGTVPEVWARADRLVRTKFKQSERELCDRTGAELQVSSLNEEELTFLLDLLDTDRDGQEHPFNSDLYGKLSQWRLENSLADVEAPEPEEEPATVAESVEEQEAVMES